MRRRGSRTGEWSLLAETTYPLYMLGRWDEALAATAEVPEEKLRAALTMSILDAALEIHVHRGDPDEARRLLGFFEHLAEATDVQDRSGYKSALAVVLRAEGRLAEALEVGVESAELSRSSFGMRTQSVKQGLVEAIEAALALGGPERAAELVGVIDADPVGAPPAVPDGASGPIPRAPGGPTTPAAAGFEAAEERFRTIGVVFWLAVTQLEHGAWLVGHGRGEDAGPLLAEARETLERLAATPWLDRLAVAEAARSTQAGARA